MSKKKLGVIILGFIGIICIVYQLYIVPYVNYIKYETSYNKKQEADVVHITEETTQWNAEMLLEGCTTAIEYDKLYNKQVSTKAEAKELIVRYGNLQRGKYENPVVEKLELQMQENYNILAVNLGELSEETAKDIEKAFAYMYETYPLLQGTLTNLTLGNFDIRDSSHIAKTQYREFIVNEESGVHPTVVQYEIVLNASKFMNKDRLLKACRESSADGHWPKDTNITSLLVHELGHHLLNVIIMKQVGLEDCYYITEANEDAFCQYMTNGLSMNQTVEKDIMKQAYSKWQTEYGNIGTEEEFRGSISEYAKGIQTDGGISYSETFAEAMADIYLHGSEAVDASKAIAETVEEWK